VHTKHPPAPTLPPAQFPADYWEHILGSLEEGVVVLDQDHRLAFVNPAAEHLTSLSATQVHLRPYTEVFASNPWIVAIIKRMLASGQSSTAGEGELQTRSLRTTPVRITGSPIFTDEGMFLGLVAVLHNLSHQKELAQEAHQTTRLAQLSMMAAGLAHEIRNPLAGIRGATQLLQGRIKNDPSSVEYTIVMLREIDRLSGLLEQLLQLSPNVRFTPQLLNVHKVLTDVLLLERESAPKGVKILTLFDPSLPQVEGDEIQLAQVFRNIIKNGVQALRGIRGGVLTVTTRIATDFHILRTAPASVPVLEPPLPVATDRLARARKPVAPPENVEVAPSARFARFLSIDVSDNGSGIAPEHLEQLFTPFFTTKSGGTGLGLAISQRIVVQHGGLIRIESEAGRGTTFHIYLPIAT
jgi:two-component system, NtrC family, nitrogen regulation sensor histidine kinase GlnL